MSVGNMIYCSKVKSYTCVMLRRYEVASSSCSVFIQEWALVRSDKRGGCSKLPSRVLIAVVHVGVIIVILLFF